MTEYLPSFWICFRNWLKWGWIRVKYYRKGRNGFSGDHSEPSSSTSGNLKDPNNTWAEDMAKHCQERMDKVIIDSLKGKK